MNRIENEADLSKWNGWDYLERKWPIIITIIIKWNKNNQINTICILVVDILWDAKANFLR